MFDDARQPAYSLEALRTIQKLERNHTAAALARERAAGIPADYAEACARLEKLRAAAELAREALSVPMLVDSPAYRKNRLKLRIAALAALAEALGN